MQYESYHYNLDRFKSLSLRQPLADKIILEGQTELLWYLNTNYRGRLLIVSRKGKGEREGCSIGFVDLTDIRKEGKLYRWYFSNPCRAIEFPCENKTRKAIWELYYTKGLIEEYPKNLRKWINTKILTDTCH